MWKLAAVLIISTVCVVVTVLYVLCKIDCRKHHSSEGGKDCSKCVKDCSECSHICPKCVKDCSKCSHVCPQCDCSKCKRDCSEKFSVGDQVFFDNQFDGVKTGCITKISGDMVDVCTEFSAPCALSYHTSLDEIHKNNYDHPIPCDFRYNDCEGIPKICHLHDGDFYPGNDSTTNFDSKKKCQQYFGKNTWGKCIKVKQKFSKMFWTLGCNDDSDCRDGRTCVQDRNPLNTLHKICSCEDDDDCQFENSGEKKNAVCARNPSIKGKTSCKKKQIM